MVHPFKRSASPLRPTLRPAPGVQAFEVDPGPALEFGEDEDDGEWEDSVQEFDALALPRERE